MQIFYYKDAKFKIIPKIHKNDMEDFRNFFINLINTYSESGKNTFFWDLNEINNTIIINKNIYSSYDILDQLRLIIFWLFNKKYNVKGFLYFRINKVIEYIWTDGKTNNIKHFMLLDDNNVEEFFDICVANSNGEIADNCDSNKIYDKILDNTKYKIEKFLEISIFGKNKKLKKNNIKIYPVDFIDLSKNCIDDENKLLLCSMTDRLKGMEDDLKSLKFKNIFLQKTLTVIGLLTAGSLFFCILFRRTCF